ncbi:MAG: bifunctional 23S rRNA (guanine(2069)-N(7))-methyltransferase RlmK/23S rRNA (guanine(2445)-N(2))-methyltransferase RlmL [Gammaproteobacteria bacterium]|nr:MAG: bifunctional 23S rRNA (guanine(2069)-N(7))-methyltransferase RlmK/23S rRNA (guanine(2445)-N(2))-methyltransferase RlmL [Gammaproteobacteria bacterium]
MSRHTFFATCPRRLEPLLAAELERLGAGEVRQRASGATFTGTVETACRVCLWSRLAVRVLLPLAEFDCPDADALYQGSHAIDWAEHLPAGASFAVDAGGTSAALRDTRFTALKVKDAVVDRLRETTGARPDVDPAAPDLQLNLRLHRGRATLSIDLSGESLHRRGYRLEGGAAPLKENLAAALLLSCGWPELATAGAPLLDPLCGSATIPIEGALMAADIAPGLLRDRYGFQGWAGHQSAVWERLLEEARQRRQEGLARVPRILGFDRDPAAIRAALGNIQRAGLSGHVHVERRSLDALEAFRGLPDAGRGLLLCNPPYGERLGTEREAGRLNSDLGRFLRRHCRGWRAGVLVADRELGYRLGLRAQRQNRFYNGPLEVTLLQFEVEEAHFLTPRQTLATGQTLPPRQPITGGEAFANRLDKNLRRLRKWARREGIDCYRLYDADLPEYALAIDLYQGDEPRLHVQEYAPPASVDPELARHRLEEALNILVERLEVPADAIYLKQRRRQKGREQYRRLGDSGELFEVREGPARLLVNLADYLDTGLFLDHRPLRRTIREQASGRSFLNLFCYTGAATVQAALGGARKTTSVDLSRTYLDWTARNLALNGFESPGARHQLLQEECLAWLEKQARAKKRPRFDLILLDPPSFSNSARMRGVLDIQRDHVRLIRAARELLAPGGTLWFSTNRRRFRLDEAALADLAPEEITEATLDPDFARRPPIHRCWRIQG